MAGDPGSASACLQIAFPVMCGAVCGNEFSNARWKTPPEEQLLSGGVFLRLLFGVTALPSVILCSIFQGKRSVLGL